MDENKENCISPEYPYCPGCKYGLVLYPEWVETYEDTYHCTCDWICTRNYKKESKEKCNA